MLATRKEKMREKRHCCCCVPLHEGVALVGIYGSSVHTALLVLQLTYGPTIVPQPEMMHPGAAEVLDPLILATHALEIFVNLLLVIGVWRKKPKLILPWLIVQGILAMILLGLAAYFLLLFPAKTECFDRIQESPQTESDLVFNPLFQVFETRTQPPFNPAEHSPCTLLLWYSVVMVISFLILVYYTYVVQAYFLQWLAFSEQLRKRKVPPPIAIVELREQREDEGIYVQELEEVTADETDQTNVTEIGDDGFAELQIKPLATSSNKRPEKKLKPTVTFSETHEVL